jgi:membrane fusion protein (multidrug efflux system)
MDFKGTTAAMNNKTIQIVIGIGVAALAAYYFFASDDGGSGDTYARPPVLVNYHQVGLSEYIERIDAIGTLKANESVTLTAQVRETVTRVNFEDGQVVEEGDILLEFTSKEEGALLREARANLLEAEKQLDRVRDLVERGNSTQSRLDAQTRLAGAATAQVAAIAARLEDRLLLAPFAGVLGFRMVSAGTLVEPGSAVTTLDDIDQVKLDFSVPETYLSALKPGLEIEARSAAYSAETFSGTVSTIGSRVDPVSRAVTVRAIIANSDRTLRPGMLVTVELVRRRSQKVMIPEEALIQRQRDKFVYVISDDDTVVQQQVQTGGRRPGAVVITSGLEVGQVIIVEGISRVFPGSKVVRQNAQALGDSSDWVR